MADFTPKKLQVFVSSTYEDLKEERQAAVEAILTAGHIPAGMELFTAGDESQMAVIKQWINECDIYMLILGGRYGSVDPKSGKSYTHLEYEYALSKDKPLFACVTDQKALEARVASGKGVAILEMKCQKELAAFRDMVTSRMVRFWEDTKDIKIAVSESLAALARRDNLVGWVRADQALSPAVTNEMARLSLENASLRTQIESLSPSKLPDVGFDVDRAWVSLMRQENAPGNTSYKLQSQIWIDAALLGTLSVGFAPRNCRAVIEGIYDQPLSLKCRFAARSGATMENVTVTGPTAFRVTVDDNALEALNRPLNQIITLLVYMQPIGYLKPYELKIQLELQLNTPDNFTGKIGSDS